MDNIVLLILLTSMVVSLIMIVLAIVSLVRLSGDNITEGKAKFATIMPPIAFGWLIGLLVYHLHTKKQLENNPELAKAGSTGNIIGVVLSFIIGILLSIFSIAMLVPAIEKMSQERYDRSQQNQTTQGQSLDRLTQPNNPQTLNEKTFKTDDFSVKMDCMGEIQKQEKDGINTTIGLCVDINNGNFLAGETIVPDEHKFDTANTALVDTLLNSTVDGFFQGAGATKTSSEKISPTKILAKGKTGNQDILIQFSLEKTSDGDLAIYQLGIMKAGGVDKTIFDKFVNSFQLI